MSDNPGRALGRARMREIAAELAREAQREQVALEADLGRQPSHGERILLEQAGALTVRARHLRRLGKMREADSVTMLLTRVMGRVGIAPGSGGPELTIAELLAARGYAPPGAQSGHAAAEQPDNDNPLGEVRNLASEASS